jgi:phage-related minor tail protein
VTSLVVRAYSGDDGAYEYEIVGEALRPESYVFHDAAGAAYAHHCESAGEFALHFDSVDPTLVSLESQQGDGGNSGQQSHIVIDVLR